MPQPNECTRGNPDDARVFCGRPALYAVAIRCNNDYGKEVDIERACLEHAAELRAGTMRCCGEDCDGTLRCVEIRTLVLT